jgi:hypothetical protein
MHPQKLYTSAIRILLGTQDTPLQANIVRRIEAIVGHLLCSQDFALGQVHQSSFALDYAVSPVPFVHLTDMAGF